MDLPAKLEALAAAADALAQIAETSPATWEALCREEVAERITSDQYFDFAGGYGERFPPELILGHRIIELLTTRHPLIMPEHEGTA